MTITKAHRDRLRALHARDPNFGVIGHLWAARVVDYLLATESGSMLDYGAGRSGLTDQVWAELTDRIGGTAFEFASYEPAFGHQEPHPADFVTCIDVMEHVEVGMYDAVLTDIRRCARKGALITISLRNRSPKKRDTHPLVKPREWWLQTIAVAFAGPYKIEEVPILDETKAKSELAVLITRIK